MFREEKKRNTVFISVLIFVFWIGFFWFAAGWLGRDSLREQQEALEQALERDITVCYALEGHFPPDLQYLREHYGLTFDEKKFYVDYRPVAANLRPEYVVIERRENALADPRLEVEQK